MPSLYVTATSVARSLERAPRAAAELLMEEVPVDLVAAHDLEVADLVARAERPHVRMARGGVVLVGRVLRLELEGAPVGGFVCDGIDAALVEARRAALADA